MEKWEMELIKLHADHKTKPLDLNEMDKRILDIIIDNLMVGQESVEHIDKIKLKKLEKNLRDNKETLNYNRSNMGRLQISRRIRARGYSTTKRSIIKKETLLEPPPKTVKLNLLGGILNECCYSASDVVMSLVILKGEELENRNVRKIERFLNKYGSGNKRCGVLMLSGGGGNTIAGMNLALMLRNKFKEGLVALILDTAGSCLVFTVFISTSLFMAEEAHVTPLKPFFRIMGGFFPVTSNLNHPDSRVRKKARKILINSIKFCNRLLDEPGSIIGDPSRININFKKRIIELFFKSPHGLKISYDMLKNLKFNVYRFNPDNIISNTIDEYLRSIKEAEENKGKTGVFQYMDERVWF